MMRRALTALALVGIATIAPSAFCADEPVANVDSATLKAAEASFKADFDTVDIELKLQSVKRFARVVHPNVAKTLVKLFKDKDPYVRAAAAKGLSNQVTSVKTVGSQLAKIATKNGEEPRVVVAAVTSIGKLDYRRGLDTLIDLMTHDDDDVVIAVFGALGAWKETEALDDMRLWFEKWPDEKGFVTVSVTVDTGTAGSGDQVAATAQGTGMLAAHKSWRPRPDCTEALRKSLKEITGKGFRRPQDLRRYLEDSPEKYRDPEEVADRLDEAARKAIFVEWHAAKAAAAAHALEKVKGETLSDGEERAKVYGKVMYAKRDDLLEQRELLLSELDVIIEQGTAAEWSTGQPD